MKINLNKVKLKKKGILIIIIVLLLSIIFSIFLCIEEEASKVRSLVEKQKNSMNLSVVRLCFQAYLPDDNGCFTKALPPCFSRSVYDSSKIT